MPPAFPPRAAALMREQHGLITTRQLRAAGTSDWSRRRLVRDALLVPVHEGVFRSSTVAATFESACLAAVLADLGGAINGPSAAVLYGLRKVRTTDVHLMVNRRGVNLEGVIVHSSTAFGPGDHRLLGGIAVLAPTRLAADLARYVSDDDLESVVEQMLDRGLVTVPGLHAMARRLRGRGRDGIRRFVRVLNGRPTWQRPAGSDIELRFVEELGRRGIELERQVRFDFADGSYVVFDAADPDRRIAIEVDHVTWHGGRVESQDDKRRDRRVLAAGWATIRVTDEDVRRRLHATADEVAAAFHATRTSGVPRDPTACRDSQLRPRRGRTLS